MGGCVVNAPTYGAEPYGSKRKGSISMFSLYLLNAMVVLFSSSLYIMPLPLVIIFPHQEGGFLFF